MHSFAHSSRVMQPIPTCFRKVIIKHCNLQVHHTKLYRRNKHKQTIGTFQGFDTSLSHHHPQRQAPNILQRTGPGRWNLKKPWSWKQRVWLWVSQAVTDWKSRFCYVFNMFFILLVIFLPCVYLLFIPDLNFICLSIGFWILINHCPCFIMSIHFSSFSLLFPWVSCVLQHVRPRNEEKVTNTQQNPRILDTWLKWIFLKNEKMIEIMMKKKCFERRQSVALRFS